MRQGIARCFALSVWHRKLSIIVALYVGTMAALATAQDVPSSQPWPVGLCQVHADKSQDGRPAELYGYCSGRGLMLGQVTSFEAIPNELLKATLVDARMGDDRRILLLTARAEGSPLVEDLTGQIALEAGRGPMAAIEGVELDLAGFATIGVIAVLQQGQAKGRLTASRIDLGAHVAAELARQDALAAQTQN